jgi:hypothetical protein
VNNRVAADLQFQKARLLRKDGSVGLPLHFRHRVSRRPLRVRARRESTKRKNEEK